MDQPASTPATLALTPGLPRAELESALELCERLTERATQLKSTWVVPEDPVDRIVLATLARCQATFRVVLELVGHGDSPHATALTRMMGEDCEIAHWLVATRPADVVDLSNDYWDWQNLRLNGDDEPSAVGMSKERADALRESFKNPGSHWTRQGTKARRKAICEWCADDSRLKALEHLFSNGDVWANAMLHHSPWGLGAAVSPLATVEQPRFVTAPSWLHSWAALLFSYLSTALTISLCNDAYGDTPSQNFEEFFGPDGLQLHAETKRLYERERERAKQLAVER